MLSCFGSFFVFVFVILLFHFFIVWFFPFPLCLFFFDLFLFGSCFFSRCSAFFSLLSTFSIMPSLFAPFLLYFVIFVLSLIPCFRFVVSLLIVKKRFLLYFLLLFLSRFCRSLLSLRSFLFSLPSISVMITHLSPKHWEWQEDRESTLLQCEMKKLTLYSAGAKKHGWTFLLSYCVKRNFQLLSVESHFGFVRCIRHGSVEALVIWLMAMHVHGMCVELDLHHGESHQICHFFWADNFRKTSHPKDHLTQLVKEIIGEAEKWELETKPASLWWTSTHA